MSESRDLRCGVAGCLENLGKFPSLPRLPNFLQWGVVIIKKRYPSVIPCSVNLALHHHASVQRFYSAHVAEDLGDRLLWPGPVPNINWILGHTK